MERITIRLPKQQVAMLEKFVEMGEFPSVSEAIRYAVRELINSFSDTALKGYDQI